MFSLGFTDRNAYDWDRFVAMKDRRSWNNKQFTFYVAILISFLLILPASSAAYSRTDRKTFQRAIVDSRQQLNPRFKKVKRKKTKYIVVHTSELGLKTTLRVVSKGKHFRNGRRTYGGHTHYVIARNGRTYRIMDKKYVADHAGRSMWNGETDLSKISIGIELVGYHYAPITASQYRSVGLLIDILQAVYNLDDRAVLTHSQVAYGKPNRWFRKDHRGRKRCAKNFIRAKAELGSSWRYDPDVNAGRLTADAQLADVFYSQRSKIRSLMKPISFPSSTRRGSSLGKTMTAAARYTNSPTAVYTPVHRSHKKSVGTVYQQKRSYC